MAESISTTTTPDRWDHWSAELPPRRGIPAWFGSLAVHFVSLTVLSVLIQESPPGTPAEPIREVGIALTQRNGERTDYFRDGDEGGILEPPPSQPSVNSAGIPASLPTAAELPTAAAPALPTSSGVSGAAALPSDFAPAAGGSTSPVGRGVGGRNGAAAETSVFGVRGVGGRFIYVFDRSASMSGFQGRPLAASKRELLGSLAKLERVHQFQIVFYNDSPNVMNPGKERRPGMFFADEAGKKAAEVYVQKIVADGGTRHVDALKTALSLAPDVIFFLTDGDEPQMRAAELAEIRRANRGAAIHAIEFGSGPKPPRYSFLERLAQENGGEYTYVDITRLPAP